MSVYIFPHGKATKDAVLAGLKELKPFENPMYKQLDDISTARLFADLFQSVLRYNTTFKQFSVYDGTRWKKDAEGMTAEKLAKMFAISLVIMAAQSEQSKNTIDSANKLLQRRYRTQMLQDCRDFYHVSAEMFDTQPNLLNCRNCVLDLETGDKLEHDSSLLLSKCINASYDSTASTATFETFIEQIMQGDKDKALYLQMIMGYALTGTAEQEECYFMYGKSTRNGKSTLLSTIEHMMGDYAANIQPESLAMKDKKNGSAPTPDIARLKGIRFLHCGEPPKRMRLDAALLKGLTGGDTQTARFLHEADFEFKPVFKLMLNTNYLPLVMDDTAFSSQRIKVIEFNRHFEESEQDIDLKRKLTTDENLSGILNWCYDGLAFYRGNNNRLTVPASVTAATAEYRKNSDKMASFIEECLVQSEGGVVTGKRAYEVFVAWCRDNGYGCESKSNFFSELKSKGLLSDTATINNNTVHNAIKGYLLDETMLPDEGSPFKGYTGQS